MPLPNYPLDLTGTAASNHIQGEVHEFTPSVKAIVPNAGAFYTRNLVVRRESDNTLMQPHIDYKALQFVREASEESGHEVCLVIQNLNPDFSGNIVLDYHAIGGEYIALLNNAVDLIEELDANRVYRWGDIINLPVDFPPRDHMQHVNTLYGANDLIIGLTNIERAIMAGDVWAFQQVYAYVSNLLQIYAKTADLNTLSDSIASALNAHFSNNNVHTPAQVGLSNLANWAIGTVQEHLSGQASRYASTAGVKAVYDALVLLINPKADKTFEIQTSGLLSGGGSLGAGGNANLQLKVDAADNAAALAGANGNLVITPPSLKHVLDQRFGTSPIALLSQGSLVDIWKREGVGVYEYDRPASLTNNAFVVAELVAGGDAAGRWANGGWAPSSGSTRRAAIISGGRAGGYGKIKFNWPSRYTKLRLTVGGGGYYNLSGGVYTLVRATQSKIELFDSTSSSWVELARADIQATPNNGATDGPMLSTMPDFGSDEGFNSVSNMTVNAVDGVTASRLENNITYGGSGSSANRGGFGINGYIRRTDESDSPLAIVASIPLGELSRWTCSDTKTHRHAIVRLKTNERLLINGAGGYLYNTTSNTTTFVANRAASVARPGAGGEGLAFMVGAYVNANQVVDLIGNRGYDGAAQLHVYR